MNIVVLENNNSLSKFENNFSEKYPKSSILRFYKEDLDVIKSKLSILPLLTKDYLVIVDCTLKTGKGFLNTICSFNNLNIFVCKDEDIFNNTKDILKSLSIKYSSTKNIPGKDKVVEYIIDKSNLPYDLAVFVYNRCGGYLPMIEENLFVISSFNSVNKSLISKYCKSSSGCNYRHVLYLLIGFKLKFSDNKVFDVIYNYRYGIDSIIKYCKNNIDLILDVYNSIRLGHLGWDNYKEFDYPKGVNIYFAKDILTNYQNVSFDYIYYIKNRLELLSSKDYIGFISLFRR